MAYGWRWMPGCACCGTVRCAFCHDVITHTGGIGTGNVTYTDDQFNPLWVYNTGTEPGTGRTKRPVCCSIDSAGNVYVAWDVANYSGTTGGMRGDNTADGPAGGVIKLNSNGVFQWEVTYAAKISTYRTTIASSALWSNQVRVDPNDDGKIWVGTCGDVNGEYVHLLDSAGATLLDFGDAQLSAYYGSTFFMRGQTHKIVVGADGLCCFGITDGPTGQHGAYFIDNTGAVVYRHSALQFAYDFDVGINGDIYRAQGSTSSGQMGIMLSRSSGYSTGEMNFQADPCYEYPSTGSWILSSGPYVHVRLIPNPIFLLGTTITWDELDPNVTDKVLDVFHWDATQRGGSTGTGNTCGVIRGSDKWFVPEPAQLAYDSNFVLMTRSISKIASPAGHYPYLSAIERRGGPVGENWQPDLNQFAHPTLQYGTEFDQVSEFRLNWGDVRSVA